MLSNNVAMDSDALRWLREHRKRQTRELKSRFLKSIRPVLQEDYAGEPDPVGTCVLLQIQGKRFVLSAAHVFDWFNIETRINRLYIENHGRFLDITMGQLYRSGKPGDDHPNDRIDAGFIALPENECPDLPLSDCLELSDLELGDSPANGPMYIAIGFPIENARPVPGQKHLNMEGITCTGPSVEDKVTALGLDHESHILVEFDRYDTWIDDKWSPAPDPAGLSGGALFRFDSLLSREAQNPKQDKLAGILIERDTDTGVMIATRSSIFVQGIQAVYPELFSP